MLHRTPLPFRRTFVPLRISEQQQPGCQARKNRQAAGSSPQGSKFAGITLEPQQRAVAEHLAHGPQGEQRQRESRHPSGLLTSVVCSRCFEA